MPYTNSAVGSEKPLVLEQPRDLRKSVNEQESLIKDCAVCKDWEKSWRWRDQSQGKERENLQAYQCIRPSLRAVRIDKNIKNTE